MYVSCTRFKHTILTGVLDGYSGWSSYGRWIVLGVVVGIAVLVWLTICCCNRRRTRAGAQPVKYTGWATPGFQHPQQTGVTNTNSNYNTQPYVAPQQQQTTYPMQNYTQYPQTGYPAQNESYAQQPYQQGVYNTGNEYSQQPPSYPAAPAPVAGREK